MVITSISPSQSFQPIAIPALKIFNPVSRKVHGEDGYKHEQVDVAVIEVGSIPTFRKNLSNLQSYIFNYNQLANATEVQSLSAGQATVSIKSRFGYRISKMGTLYPKVHPAIPPQTMVGFRLDDISPPVRDGGDSGGAIFAKINGAQKIYGMFSKGPGALADNPNPGSGAATDSVMIRETIDLFFK